MKNKLVAYTSSKPFLKLVIEYEEGIGYYLYAFDTTNNNCIADYLQDTLEFAKEDGKEFYGINRILSRLFSWL